MKIAILFDRFGPYHIARLEAAAKFAEIFPVEISSETSEYQWNKVESAGLRNRITLFQKESSRITSKEISKTLSQHLNTIKPDVVAVNGWSDRSALCALYWCLQKEVPAVVMSESSQNDGKRSKVKELIKSTIVKQFSSALVGGSRHANYLENLGMKKTNIFFGYDVVDNKYFEKGSDEIRKEKSIWLNKTGLPENYFLVVSRFVEKKNLPFIIQAFNQYYLKQPNESWSLLILGDGELKNELIKTRDSLGLESKIIFEGFKQYEELPIYFALASAFIHVSIVEQWGLVVNEAMASGLPVLVSNNCGCVPELVHDGINGYVINPYDIQSLSEKMELLSKNSELIKEMGKQSRRIISEFDAPAFGTGLFNAAKAAQQNSKKGHSGIASAIIKAMIR